MCIRLLSCVQLFGIPSTVACRALLSSEFCLQEYTGAGCHFLLQGIFPTQRSSPGLLCLLRWPTGKPVDWFPASPRTGPIHSYEEPALVGSRFGQMNEGLLSFWRLACDPRRQHWVAKAQVPKGLWSLRLWGSGVLSDRRHMAGASRRRASVLV